MPLAVPAFVSSFAWLSLSARAEGMASAVLIIALAEYPLVFLPVAVALRGMDGGLDDVACGLGQGPWRRFWSVVLPQLRPAIAASGLLVALHMLIEFGPLAILRVDTFTTAIYATFELEFDSAAAAVLSGALLPGRRDGACVQTVMGKLQMAAGAPADGSDVTVLLRPEQVVAAPEGTGTLVKILDRTFLGPLVWVELMADGVLLQACWPATVAGGVGTEAWVTVRGRVGVFPA